jgi:plastocyanin
MNANRHSLGRGAFRTAVFLMITAAFGMGAGLLAPRIPLPTEKSFTIHMRRYEYYHPVLQVNRGDTVRLKFVAEDVVHGFYLEGYDLDAVVAPLRTAAQLQRPSTGKRETAQEAVFTADREGKFRYRCSQTCGYLHPFMLGVLVVRPNRLLPVSIGLALGILVAGLVLTFLKERPS